MRRGWALSCVGIVLLLQSCSSSKQADAGDEAAAPVTVEAAKREDIQQVITVEAVLYPQEQANIVPKISAPVSRFLVQRGDHVKKGQLLAVLEHADLAAAEQESQQLYQQAEATYKTTVSATMPDELAKSEADTQAAQQTAQAAQSAYESRRALYQQGALAKRLVEDARATAAQAQAQYVTARQHLESLQKTADTEQKRGALAQMDAAKAHYEGAAAQAAYAEVRSPISGVVSDRPTNVGEMASVGSALLSIVDISRVTARASVSLQQASAIHKGDRATIIGPGGQIAGVVTVVSPAVDPNTTTVQIWAAGANPGEKLKLGGTVQLAIDAGKAINAIVIPVSALLTADDGGDKVMVAGSDSLAHERPVKTGIRSGDDVQVVEGLTAGERVITDGALGLDDKAKIRVQEPATNQKDDEK